MKKHLFTAGAALALALLMLLSAVSCGSAADPATTTGAQAEATTVPSSEEITEVSYDPMLPAGDWQNADFVILYNGNTTEPNLDFIAEDTNGATLNDAVYGRNMKIQEKYKLTINPQFFSDSKIVDNVKIGNSSGDVPYHLTEANQTYSMTMAINGYIHSLDELEKLDFSKPYWFSSALKGSSIGGKNYFAYSDANVHAFGATPCTIFNKTVAEEFKVGNIYQIVADNQWTYARMSEMVKAVTGDLNGDLLITKDDRLGMIANTFCIDCFISGSGYEMVIKDEDDLPVLNIESDQFINIIDGITSLCSADNGMFLVDRTDTSTEAREYWTEHAITEDRALFWIGNFKCVERLRVSDTDFGVVPIPKANEDQTSYKIHMQANIGAAMSVPECVTDTDAVSAVIEDIAYQSYLTVMPAYMDVLIQGQSIRDVDSLACIKLIRDSYYCDMGFMLGNYGVSILTSMRAVVKDNSPIASMMKSYSNAFNAKIKALKKTLEKNQK